MKELFNKKGIRVRPLSKPKPKPNPSPRPPFWPLYPPSPIRPWPGPIPKV